MSFKCAKSLWYLQIGNIDEKKQALYSYVMLKLDKLLIQNDMQLLKCNCNLILQHKL
jgi:hypothetical protein